MRFNIVLADPPWKYGYTGSSRSVENHYPTMTCERIYNMPVQDIVQTPAVCLLWATIPKIKTALTVLERWGFEYKTFAFVWVKTNKSPQAKNRFFSGMGAYTRSNVEFVLLGTKTDSRSRLLPVLRHDISQLIISPRGRHSAKPPIVRDKIVALFGDIPRIELFAREETPGWVTLGNEIDSLDIYDSLQITASSL